MNSDLTHLCDNLIQSQRFIFKILTINKRRIIPLLKRTLELFLSEFSFFESGFCTLLLAGICCLLLFCRVRLLL